MFIAAVKFNFISAFLILDLTTITSAPMAYFKLHLSPTDDFKIYKSGKKPTVVNVSVLYRN